MKRSIKTQSKLLKFIVAASFVGLGSAALALESPAASTTNGSISYPVGYSDLDVSTMKGAKTLYLRITFAAETLCESAATWGKREGQACVNEGVDNAVVRLNRPLLSQYHQLRTKGIKAGIVQLVKAN